MKPPHLRNQADKKNCRLAARHDRLFKQNYQNPRHAKGVFRTLLPPAFVRRVDWNTLKLESGDYLRKAFGELRSDLLFSVKLKDGDEEILLYLLM